MNLSPIHKQPRFQRAFSLVELMVAIAIGLMLTAGLTAVFVNNSQASGEIERANRQIENGRYAMNLLTEDLRVAGFLAEFDPSVLATPAVLPDACATAIADLKTAMPLHVQGYDNGAVPALGCLDDVRAATDILVVRRASTCVAGVGECEAVQAGIPYFQASLCNDASELASGSTADHYALDLSTGTLDRHKRNCTTVADVRRYRTHVYFIANNGTGTDGIPTLKRAELGSDGAATDFSIVALVDGIENMQLEYGIDTDNDGSPNAYTAAPGTFGGCAGAACVTNWQNVVTVRLILLARNNERSPGHTDSKIYTLGLNADGSENSVGPFNDNIKRHAYQGLVKLSNPAGRRE